MSVSATTLAVHAAQKWQYHHLGFDSGREFNREAPAELNRLGAEGWEVCGFVRFEIGRIDGYRLLLKRPYALAGEPV